MDLKGAVALVTGGNGGLGQRICHALAKEGAHIAVMYAQSRDQAEGVARELTSQLPDQCRRLRLRHHRCRRGRHADRRRHQALRPARYPGQRRRLQQVGRVPRPRQPDRGTLGQDHGGQPDRPDAPDQGRGAGHEGAGAGPDRQHLVRRRTDADRVVDRLCGVEGRPDPPDALHGGGAGARDAGELRRARPAGGHARHRQPAPGDDRASTPRTRC